MLASLLFSNISAYFCLRVFALLSHSSWSPLHRSCFFLFWSSSTVTVFLRLLPTALFFNHNLPSQCKNTPYPFLLYILHSIYHDLTCHVMYLASDYLNVSLMGTEILLSYYSLLIPVIRTVSATNIYWKNELTRDICFGVQKHIAIILLKRFS